MNKNELAYEIAHKTGLSKKDSDAVINAFVAVVGEQLAKGEKVQLTGFGTFEVTEKKERMGRNPHTGETITIAASKCPKFKAGRELKKAVNQ